MLAAEGRLSGPFPYGDSGAWRSSRPPPGISAADDPTGSQALMGGIVGWHSTASETQGRAKLHGGRILRPQGCQVIRPDPKSLSCCVDCLCKRTPCKARLRHDVV